MGAACLAETRGQTVPVVQAAREQAGHLFRKLRKTEGLDVLYQTAIHVEADPDLSNEAVGQWAQFLFEVGDKHKTYAQGGASGYVQPGYPGLAREIFYKNLDWYGDLTDPQRDSLGKLNRTLIITSFIGQLFIVEKDYNGAITQYEGYAQSHLDWLGLDAITVWQHALLYGSFKSDPVHWQAFANAIYDVLDRPESDSKIKAVDRAKWAKTLEEAQRRGAATTGQASRRGNQPGNI